MQVITCATCLVSFLAEQVWPMNAADEAELPLSDGVIRGFFETALIDVVLKSGSLEIDHHWADYLEHVLEYSAQCTCDLYAFRAARAFCNLLSDIDWGDRVEANIPITTVIGYLAD